MDLVIDASTTLLWYFQVERTPESDAILDQVVVGGAIVPALWRLEVANGLQMAIRRKRIDKAFRDLALQRLEGLPIVIDPEGDAHVWGRPCDLPSASTLLSTTAPIWSWHIAASFRSSRWMQS